MAEVILEDIPETLERLQSVKVLMSWLRSMPQTHRRQLLAVLLECGAEVQDTVECMLRIAESPEARAADRQGALAAIAEVLFPDAEHAGKQGQNMLVCETNPQDVSTQQASFAERLRELMVAKGLTQQELADRAGCPQPAISQMLSRNCRPQKKTILKLAEALGVNPRDLWPDLEVAEMLDAVAAFQQDDYEMTEAEAAALQDTSRRNPPKIPVRSLPVRRR